ncbi:MAG: AAA family ATPase [Pyrobaculum sp.]
MAIRDVVKLRDSFIATKLGPPEEKTTPTFRAVGLGPFDEFEIRLRPLTVLIGKNSVGKSLAMTAMWLFAYVLPGDFTTDEGLVKKFDERRDEAALRELIINAAEKYLKAFAEGIYKISHEVTALRGSRLELTAASGKKLEIEITEGGALIHREDVAPIFNQVEVVKEGPMFRITYNGVEAVVPAEPLASVINGVLLFVNTVYYRELYPWRKPLYPLLAPHFLVDGRSGLIRASKLWAPCELSVLDDEFLKSYYMLSEKTRLLIPSEAFQSFVKELGIEKAEARLEGGYYKLYVELWNGVEMPIEWAPSGVREALLPALALELTYGLLFVEEPEAHLHPAAIVKFAQLLAHAVNRGNRRVVLSTHSDYLLSKLSNLVRASALDEEKLRKLGLRRDLVLPRDKIAVYLIKADRERKRSVVEELPVDEEGISEQEFSKVAEELLNESSYVSLLRS